MKKNKGILCTLLALSLLIPQVAHTSGKAPVKAKFSRQLLEGEFQSIKNGDFNCFNNYSLARGGSERLRLLSTSSGLLALLMNGGLFVITIKGIIIIGSVTCILEYKNYQNLRKSIGRANLEKMTIYELAELMVIIGERRAKSKILVKKFPNKAAIARQNTGK